jgi:very-short-patch-repair endonuclease
VARNPRELPAEVRGRPFRIQDHPDLSRARLRAADLWIPARGTRLDRQSASLRDRCAAHALTLPAAAAFSGLTAAALLRLPLPRWAEDAELLDVTVLRGTRAPRRKGVVAHERALTRDDVVRSRGLTLTSPARTFLDLGAVLPLAPLVAVGDRILARRAPLATRAQLEQAVAASTGRGSRRAREALLLVIDGSESPKETELRLLLCDAGFGPFAANHVVLDPLGRFVARVDLALVDDRIAVEYEGDHHRDPGQWRRDLARRRRLEALGWTYLPVTQADLADPRPLLADLRAALTHRRESASRQFGRS